MVTKTITIMNDAYEILAGNKIGNESFSEVIRRTFAKKKDLSKFIGILNISDKEAENMINNIKELRKKSTTEMFKRVEKL